MPALSDACSDTVQLDRCVLSNNATKGHALKQACFPLRISLLPEGLLPELVLAHALAVGLFEDLFELGVMEVELLAGRVEGLGDGIAFDFIEAKPFGFGVGRNDCETWSSCV